MQCNIQYDGCQGTAVIVTTVGGRRIKACRSCARFSRTSDAFRGKALKTTWLAQYRQDVRDGRHYDRAEFPNADHEWAWQARTSPWPNDADDPRDERARVAQFIRQARRFEYVEGDTENELIPPSPQHARVTQDMRASMKRFSPQVQEMIADQILREKYENRQNDN